MFCESFVKDCPYNIVAVSILRYCHKYHGVRCCCSSLTFIKYFQGHQGQNIVMYIVYQEEV